MSIIPFIISITMEINLSSKVYSKSLLKVESLKGSVVCSLILDYQFYACAMWVSGVPQLQTIHTECYIAVSDTIHLMHELTGALLRMCS